MEMDIEYIYCTSYLYRKWAQSAAALAILEELCGYLTGSWLETLIANPQSWARLFVSLKACGDLEASRAEQWVL